MSVTHALVDAAIGQLRTQLAVELNKGLDIEASSVIVLIQAIEKLRLIHSDSDIVPS